MILAFVADGVRFSEPVDFTFQQLGSFEIEPPKGHSLRVRCFPEDVADYWRTRGGSKGSEFAAHAETLTTFWNLRDYPVVEMFDAPGHVFWFTRWMECLLRLFAPGHIRVSLPTVKEDDGRTGGWESPFDKHYSPWPGDFQVDGQELEAFFSFVDGLSSTIRGHTETAISFRYFTRSYSLGRLGGSLRGAGSDERLDIEDAILLLTVALEALFAFGQKDELAFKLRTRATRFVAATQTDAILLDRLLHWAYGIRSHVAHGDFKGFKIPKTLEPLGRDGRAPSPSELAELLRNVVRVALLGTANALRLGWTRNRMQEVLDSPFPSGDLATLRGHAAVPVASGVWPPPPQAGLPTETA